VPLFLNEEPVGAICLERDLDSPPFGPDDGELLSLLAHQVPIAMEIARLLTERERLQSALRQEQKMAAVGQLAGGIAHDINNMLTVLQNSLSLLSGQLALTDSEAAEFEVIASTTRRGTLLTQQLLSVSRHRPVPLAAHDANALLLDMRPTLERTVGENVRLTLSLSPSILPVMTEPASFEQCIVNLAINAREAMPNGGVLTIETRSLAGEVATATDVLGGAGQVVIVVADTGVGMSADVRERAFEPFFTTKSIGGRTGTGSGLGLSSSYAFAKRCGGNIELASESGRGTTLRLFLPSASVERELPPPVVVTPTRSPDKITVLVVDDEPDLVRTTQRILERAGYRVLHALRPSEALDLVARQGHEIGVVLLDVLMPEMTGPELGRRIVEMGVNAKLLYFSGYTPDAIPGVDANNFVQKPFLGSDLLNRLRVLLAD